MNKINKEKKVWTKRKKLIAYAATVVLLFITGLWPLALLIAPGFIIYLVLPQSKTVEPIVPASPPVESSQPETELSITQKAFGLVQRRITEQIELQYPGARWIWGIPNAIEKFKNGEPLFIHLNGAGGYNKAQVVVYNLVFRGIRYAIIETPPTQPDTSLESPAEISETEVPDSAAETETEEKNLPEEIPVNYGRLAFEWVEAHIVGVNTQYNEAIAQSQSEMLIPADDLPHPDSWLDVCEELKRNGFSVAEFCEDGIKVNITQ